MDGINGVVLFELTIPAAIRALTQFRFVFDKAKRHADVRKFDANQWLPMRLAPDQFPFVRQVQIVTDTAKGCAARLSGQEPPSYPDTEATFAELEARVHKTVAYLKGFSPEHFHGAETRNIRLPFFPEGKFITGHEYATQYVLPNLYFHMTTAYSILRVHGVDVGKSDYLGEMPFR